MQRASNTKRGKLDKTSRFAIKHDFNYKCQSDDVCLTSSGYSEWSGKQIERKKESQFYHQINRHNNFWETNKNTSAFITSFLAIFVETVNIFKVSLV